MLNESMVLRRLRRAIGTDLFDALDQEWLFEILREDTLITMSTYYPYLIRGVVMRQGSVMQSRHPQTGQIAYYKYQIPSETPDLPFIGIEYFYFPGNNLADRYSGIAPGPVDAMMGKLRSMMPTPDIRYSVLFEPPNIAVVDPIPATHRDFTLDMQRVRQLHEFPLTYHEYLTNLFIYDTKLAIYNQYKNARDSAVLGGIEIQTYISDYADAKGDRDSLLEKFDADYLKNPERFRSFVSYS